MADKQDHFVTDEDTHREVTIMSTIKGVSMKDVVREGVELYKLKHRLTDRVRDFDRK